MKEDEQTRCQGLPFVPPTCVLERSCPTGKGTHQLMRSILQGGVARSPCGDFFFFFFSALLPPLNGNSQESGALGQGAGIPPPGTRVRIYAPRRFATLQSKTAVFHRSPPRRTPPRPQRQHGGRCEEAAAACTNAPHNGVRMNVPRRRRSVRCNCDFPGRAPARGARAHKLCPAAEARSRAQPSCLGSAQRGRAEGTTPDITRTPRSLR